MEPEIEDIFYKVVREEHETFAVEIIQRLKYHYRLYDSRKCSKTFLYATDDICDAICAISFVFRCHYRQVYYSLREEIANAEEYEKFCFSLPVARSKRYTFNFLFRISFMFEIAMYLFKDGHDYLHIAGKCIANYPDHLHFDLVGNWERLNNISAFIICVSKVWEVDIAVEHPLLGTFIETEEYIGPDDVFDINLLLQESLEIYKVIESGSFPIFEEHFFKHDDIQSLKVLYKYFVAPRTPKTKCNAKDLNKIAETFPLNRQIPFVIDGKSFSRVYDLFTEKKEILYYLRSYMDPDILEKYFPLKTSPDSPDELNHIEDNLYDIPEYFASEFSQPDSGEESYELDFLKNSFPKECDNMKCDEYIGLRPRSKVQDCSKDPFTYESSKDETNKSGFSKCSFSQEWDNMNMDEYISLRPRSKIQDCSNNKNPFVYENSKNESIKLGFSEGSFPQEWDKMTVDEYNALRLKVDWSKIKDTFASESSEEEPSKSGFSKGSFPQECGSNKLYKNGESPCKPMMSCEKVNTSTDDSYDGTTNCTGNVNQYIQLPNEDSSEIPHVNQGMQLPNKDIFGIPCANEGMQLPNKGISKIPYLVSSIPELPVDRKVSLIKSIMDISHMSKARKDNIIKMLPTMPEAQYFDLSFLTNILMAVQHCPYYKSNAMSDSLRNISYVSRHTKYILFKIIMNCNGLTSDKKGELCSLLVNLPDNPIAHKVKVVQVIQKMNGCTNRIKSELIQCLLDLPDEESAKLHISDSEKMDIIEQYNVPFPNEVGLRREYEKCLLLYKDESRTDMDRLQELCRHYNIRKECLIKLAKEDAAKKLASRTIAVPNKSRQESNKSLKNAKDPKKKFLLSQDANKCFKKGAVAAGTSSVASNPVPLVEKSCQKSVSGQSPNKQHLKSTKKSKKRSKK